MTVTDIRDLKNGDYKALEGFLDANELWASGDRVYPRDVPPQMPVLPKSQEVKLLAWTFNAHVERDDDEEAEVGEYEE